MNRQAPAQVLLIELCQLLHQTTFAAGSISLVDNTTARQSVEISHSFLSSLARLFQITAVDRSPCLLDQCTRTIAIRTIMQAPFFILA